MCFCILSPHLLQKYLAQTALLTIIEKQCITNTSSAVAPIYNLDEKLWPKPEYFTQNVKYVGRKTNLLKHCVPSPGSRCFDNSWIIKNSLSHSRINNLITDRRWEELPTFVTKDIHKYGMDMYYDKVTTINSHNFMLPFSVLIKYEAHLFLCDGPDVSSYNCYWFMIDAWNGKSSAIRVCDSGNIQKQYEGGKPPSGICGSSTADYKLDASILSKTKWTHLKIVANNYKLKLINEEGRVLINATNLQRNIIPGHVIIHSKRVIGMWKMHTFDYFYSDSEGTTEFKLDVGSGQRCLSMLSSMCNKCTMLIQILTYFWKWKYSDNILYSRELPNDANGNWQEHKFHFNTEEATVYIRINKSGSAGKSNFWAVSDIRTCETNELRITQIDDQNKWTRKCQHLATGEIMDLDEPKIEKLEDRNKCNEYQFGEDCISCKTIFGQNLCPKQSKYCQLVATENSNILRKRCFCSIGSAGRNCKDSCLASNYGHGCSGNCKNCQDTCSRDPIFGKCDSKFCTDNFQGEKCDQPSIIFIFSQEPKIEPEYRSCKVTLKSFDGTGIKVGMQFYKFQYRKKGQSEWKNTTSVPFNEIRMIEITGLEVQSNYELRMFGYKEIPNMDEMRFIENENILPTYTFQTICRDPKSNDISIITDAFSATITYLKAIDQELCDIDAYTNNVNGTTINISNEANPYKMINLKPFSLYIFSISKNLNNIVSKEFRTLESAPGKPEEFIYEEDLHGSITLKWKEPSQVNGNLIYYSMSEIIRFKVCEDPNILLETTRNLSGIQRQFQIPDLKPYARYSFSIKAHTVAGSSESANLVFETLAKDKPDEEEFPKLMKISLDVTQVKIEFNLMDCKKLTGTLKVVFKVRGMDSWCNVTRFSSSLDLQKRFIISDLIAYCNYEVTLQYFRVGIVQKEEIIRFKTEEGVPNPVNDLLVTSKGTDFFSLRWLPPYPPTGKLEKYNIAISYKPKTWYDFKYDKSVTFVPEACELWPELHCTRIAVDNEHYVYQFEVSSKNQGNGEFSVKKNICKQAEESTPGKPYGLSYSWTYENFLYLEWFLPNETNGKLTGFDVFVDGIPHEYNLDPQEEYKLKYNKTIQENFKLPKQYAVRITARNLAGTSEPDVIFTKKSPPPIPSNSIISTDRTENSLRVIFNEPDTPMYYQRFFYGLITECDTCDDDLVIEFKKVLMDHHISYDEVETKTTISFWKRVINYKYQQPTEKFLSINISNTTMNYAIKKSATYLVAFIWINKEQGFIRSKYTLIKSKGQSIRHPDGNLGSIGIASIVVLTLFLIVMLAVIGVRYKTPLINKVRSIFAAKEQDRRITESSISLNPTADEVRYVNRQELKMSGYKSGRRASRCIRPLSVLFTEEICPGVPQFKTIHSKRIKLEDLRQYVKQAIESGELATQHAAFPKGQTKPWDYGKLPENKTKNRYQNLIAYDHSRVVLNKFDRDEYSDYINANYIDGYQRPKAYIATQGPKPNTVKDFWQMIWEEKATHIVMMANVIEGNKKKTEQYWPNVNEEVTFGDYKITFIHSEIHAHYEYRKFKVQFKYSTPRQVAQLHFKVWPDHGVPLYPQTLIPFLQRLLILRSWDFPLVVHCSAGVGRTGTIILCDICLRMAASEGSVDIFSMLEHLRNQRPNMVDNIEQYKLAHLVILNCLMGLNTSIPIDEDFENSAKKIKNIDHQLNYIRDCEWEDEAMKTVAFYDDEELPFDPTKNRFAHIIPDKAASVFLLPISTQSNSAYINAVHVDGFCHPRRFIVTEFPLPHTIGDFWRLIAERDISVVICLNEIPVNDLTCKLFWPKHNKNLVPNEIIEVKHIQSKNLQSYSIMNFELSSYYEHRGKETKEVQIVKFHGWNYPDIIDHSDFFTFVEEAMMIGRHSNQILVTCYDGVTACGLFTAMSFLIEKIKLEQECDVCQAIRTIRTSRKQFCNTKDQLQFLYKASILYVQERFQTYSNINMKK
ncbi:unnamed protein product [Ceutorhynchus assimilis]|uniref:protein-tyrosine-phosphatase n=1 Tax=Ceutorhynchus assimilis TaxID=467358 RepID=A0A9N9MN43_9CUCU|nr:unnamed protein product [Ceutorhynchus assimilis]